MSSIEEIAADVDTGVTTLEEAWDLISQGKEKIQEVREQWAALGGSTPPEKIGNAIAMCDEAYGQAEQAQGLCTSASEQAKEYRGVVTGG
jgi:hypothetical protein